MVDNFVKVGLIVVIILLVGILGTMSGYVIKIGSPTTTTISSTTTLVTTQPTTTIPVFTPNKAISILGATCNKSNYITLIIENIGNTRIEKDDIKIYVDGVYKGTFGKIIEFRDSNAGTIKGNLGTNNIKAVSPTNEAGIPVYCSGTDIYVACSKGALNIVSIPNDNTVIVQNAGQVDLSGDFTLVCGKVSVVATNLNLPKGEIVSISGVSGCKGQGNTVRVTSVVCPNVYTECIYGTNCP